MDISRSEEVRSRRYHGQVRSGGLLTCMIRRINRRRYIGMEMGTMHMRADDFVRRLRASNRTRSGGLRCVLGRTVIVK